MIRIWIWQLPLPAELQFPADPWGSGLTTLLLWLWVAFALRLLVLRRRRERRIVSGPHCLPRRQHRAGTLEWQSRVEGPVRREADRRLRQAGIAFPRVRYGVSLLGTIVGEAAGH